MTLIQRLLAGPQIDRHSGEIMEEAADVIADLLLVLEQAAARIEIANAEGNPILSAWLPEATSTIAKVKASAPISLLA